MKLQKGFTNEQGYWYQVILRNRATQIERECEREKESDKWNVVLGGKRERSAERERLETYYS